MMMKNAYQIKAATLIEAPQIYQMAYELAHYQGLAHRLCITQESLGEMMTDPNEHTKTIVAVSENQVIGFAMHTLLKNNRLYHHGYAMYVDELFVPDIHRGKGVGSALLKHIAKQALLQHCNRVEWWVSAGNEEAAKFYENIGARPLTEFMTYRLQGQALEDYINN